MFFEIKQLAHITVDDLSYGNTGRKADNLCQIVLCHKVILGKGLKLFFFFFIAQQFASD